MDYDQDKGGFADLMTGMGGPRGVYDLNPAASAILGTLTIDPLATLRDRILKQQGILEEQTRGIDIDPTQYVKKLEEAFAAAGLDQQGNPIKEEVVDLKADTTASDLLPTIDPSLASVAANTGPFVTDPAVGANNKVLDPNVIIDDAEKRGLTVQQILDEYQGTSPDGDPYNIGEVIFSLIISGNPNARKILDRSGYVQPAPNPDAGVDPNAAANNQAGVNADGVAGDNGTGGTVGADTGAGVNSGTPQGGTPAPQGGTPQGVATPNGQTSSSDIPTDKSPIISPDSPLDQTDTGDVKVDDQPAGLLNIPTSVPKQPEKKAGMIIEIAQSTPIVETVLDDYLYPPMFRELNNVKQSPFPTALLFSNGLMGSFV